MNIEKLHLLWFSATATTKHVIGIIAEQFEVSAVIRHDITKPALHEDVFLGPNDLLIVGMPVYSGRIPAIAVGALNKFKGSKTPVVMACVYGNRDYDDALLELKDLLQANDFVPVSVGAFIAQHSIFPAVGASRPDEKDREVIAAFGAKSAALLSSLDDVACLPDLGVKGRRPYKKPGKVPLTPKVDKKCDKCGLCVKMCPTKAIPSFNPRISFGRQCIACARCIVSCPQQARHFGGFIYKIAGKKFVKDCSLRKEPEMVYPEML